MKLERTEPMRVGNAEPRREPVGDEGLEETGESTCLEKE